MLYRASPSLLNKYIQMQEALSGDTPDSAVADFCTYLRGEQKQSFYGALGTAWHKIMQKPDECHRNDDDPFNPDGYYEADRRIFSSAFILPMLERLREQHPLHKYGIAEQFVEKEYLTVNGRIRMVGFVDHWIANTVLDYKLTSFHRYQDYAESQQHVFYLDATGADVMEYWIQEYAERRGQIFAKEDPIVYSFVPDPTEVERMVSSLGDLISFVNHLNLTEYIDDQKKRERSKQRRDAATPK